MYIAINMSDGINCLLISFSLFSLILVNFLIFKDTLHIIDIGILLSLTFLSYFNYKNLIFLGNSGASLIASYLFIN